MFTKSSLKNSIIVFGSMLILQSSLAFASADRFLVEVSSNPMMLNEAVDLTVKAVDKNGNTVKSFVGDALLNVNGLDENSYKLPNGGVVNFSANAQGEVKFRKGLIVNKVGKITLSAEDILEENLRGSLQIEVKDPNSAGNLKKVSISSPAAGAIETNSNVNIIGNSKELPNSPLQIIIDGKLNTSSSTNANGEFSVFANDIKQGDHTLTVNITNAAGTVIAKSDDINFTVGSLANELFKSIKADPGTNIKEGEKVTLTMTTAPEVSTVELIILGNSYFMEKVKSGIYEKILKFNTKNPSIQVDAKLTADGNIKTYTNIETLSISSGDGNSSINSGEDKTINNGNNSNENTSNIEITSIKSIYDPVSKKYLISWTSVGNPERYLVLITSNKEEIQSNPELIQTTTEKQILITPPSNKEYYLQVIGADKESNPIGKPSEIIKLLAPDEYKPSAPSCVVDSIRLSDTVIAGRHYLVRDKIPGVDRYIVYRWNNMNEVKSVNPVKLGETIDNKFEFSFDESASQPMYRYFAVQGICFNGDSTDISRATEIEVGPINIALYLCMIIGFTYASYSLLKREE